MKDPPLYARLVAASDPGDNSTVMSGGWLTVTTNVSLAVSVPSLTVTVIAAVPVWPDAGVTVTVRSAPLPPKAMFALGTRAVLLLPAVRVKADSAVSASPTVNAIAPVLAPTKTVWSGMLLIVGTWLFWATVKMKLLSVVSSPSLTVSVMVAMPVWSAAGVTMTVRFAPLPPKTMFASGMRVVSLLLAPMVSESADVSTSPMVKAIAPVAEFAVTPWALMLLIVGASLTALTVSRKLLLVVACPSLTVTVIVAVPLAFAAGVTVTVRSAPLPPRTMLESGTSASSLLVAVTVSAVAAVSASPTVKAIAPVAVSSSIT